ncbi:hypothetical protein ACJJIE_03930 [Microbulbifer sp. TRSA001]|uniref:RipA family octameric membrane protein n=1 Tax=unclassified Microbulbifer TaxID=2619833 RepID=UPI0024AD540F|nr:hypothetical protein [Microbulbifer sp. VAAF005]WHI46604.1 hypothetical protein P0078_23335 [Microbulbifer sp. VAAF005]
MPEIQITSDEYNKHFPQEKREKALRQALDIRKFEVELYWKRATYFWTFIGAIFAGYIAIQVSKSGLKQDLSVILSCLGFVFSVAWFCVNRGSKHWQENWEKHVDLLEDDVMGPLYKVVLTRSETKSWKYLFLTSPHRSWKDWLYKGQHLISGPTKFSVSKINQIISLYVALIWLVLIKYALPEFNFSSDFNPLYVTVVSISAIASLLFIILGRSYGGGYWHNGTIRTSMIMKE